MRIVNHILLAIFSIMYLLFSCNNTPDTVKPTNTYSNNDTFSNNVSHIVKKMDSSEIKIDAVQLSSAYIQNEIRADKLFKGKTVVVTGVIKEIKKGLTGNIYVILVGKERMRSILCDFNDVEKASDLSKNMKVTFRGICDGLMANIIIEHCELVSALN